MARETVRSDTAVVQYGSDHRVVILSGGDFGPAAQTYSRIRNNSYAGLGDPRLFDPSDIYFVDYDTWETVKGVSDANWRFFQRGEPETDLRPILETGRLI